jgi:hypothetical protein
MSWVYLPAPEADCLPPDCSDGALSAPSRSTHIVSECSLSVSVTDTSIHSPSGMTSPLSTVARGATESTSSLEDSPVRTSLLLVGVQVWRAIARDFGSKGSASLAKFGLRMSSPKTPRCFALEDSTSSSVGLPTWGLMLRGVCLELGTSVRPTEETECGSLLPTPTGAGNENSPSMQKWPAHRALAGMLATPTASGSDARNTNRPSARSTKTQLALAATPTASSYGTNQGGAAGRVGKVRHNLEKSAVLAGMLPTPTTRDWKSGAASEETHARNSRPLNEVAHRQGVTGGIFIALREWMMGWPLGWSASEPLATGRFQQWLNSHGSCSDE